MGDSVPSYMRECIHQIRLWNPDTAIYVILDPCHTAEPFFQSLVQTYGVKLVFTDTLQQTPHHAHFNQHYAGDTAFRKGYWKHVKERFFYMEECMAAHDLSGVIAMEYDVLLYTSLEPLLRTLQGLPQGLRIVRDNEERGHPGFVYIPTLDEIKELNVFIASTMSHNLGDMDTLAVYANIHRNRVYYFPVITLERNLSIKKRFSKQGHTTDNSWFLSEDSEALQLLFDSAVVGQWVGGIDSRNTGGHKVSTYENESSLYSIREMQFGWKKDPVKQLWQPSMDGRVLATIHVHSKALKCFLSDRPDAPTDDYDVAEVYKTLVPN